ncbi:hypothetical protein PO124_22545 [Bacillus licheniformis]|nr:hypothetical protein [Bacillus licheniformis]
MDDIDNYGLKEKKLSRHKGTMRQRFKDMENAHKFIEEAEDKNHKKSGIGTPATRAEIIEVLCKRNLLKGK